MAGRPTSCHACVSLGAALVFMLAGCEGRPLPADSTGFGDTRWDTGESDDEGPAPAPDLPGTDDGTETGVEPCQAIVDTLIIHDDTPPESFACVEQVLGDLKVGPTTMLIDLGSLSNLREVGGMLSVYGNDALTSLHGLELLEHATHLDVRRNHELEDLHGLDSLAAVEHITIANNEGLLAVDGLPPGLAPSLLEIEDNKLLANLDGLPQFFTPAPEAIHIEIENNPTLGDLGGLSDCCAAQAASILIGGNTALTDLSGLDGFVRLDSLRLHDNVALASLAGLDNLVELQTLDVDYDHCVPGMHASLVNFGGMPSLAHVDVLQIQWVDSLTSLAGLEPLDELSKLLVRNNEMLPYVVVESLIAQTDPLVLDTCGGTGGPECVPEPCPMY